MDKLLGTLTVGIIFRHFLSGGVFVAAFLYTRDRKVADIPTILEQHAVLWSILALLVGTLIYSVHRGVTMPVLEAIRHYLVPRFIWPVIMPPRVKARLLDRWEFAWKENKKAYKANHIYAWGDYVHFLYTSGLAVWLGSISASILTKSAANRHWAFDRRIFYLGVFFVAVGFFTDCRKHIIEDELFNEPLPSAEANRKPLRGQDEG